MTRLHTILLALAALATLASPAIADDSVPAIDTFEAAVHAAQRRYSAASSNDLLREKVRNEENAKLCDLIPAILATTEWTGKLITVQTNFDVVILKFRIGTEFQGEYVASNNDPELAAVAAAIAGATLKFTGKLDDAAPCEGYYWFHVDDGSVASKSRLLFNGISNIRVQP